MAKESEPRAKPITVSELIARSESSGSAFPKSDEDDRPTRRVIGASGMPSHTPSERDANAVTGIIPVVDDSSLEPVPSDDLLGVDLPPLEYRTSTGSTQPDPDLTSTTQLSPVASDETGTDDYDAYTDSYAEYDDEYEDDESGHRRVASAADLEAAEAEEAEAEAEAKERADELADAESERKRQAHSPSALMGWLSLAGEVVIGLAAGAGLFWGFTELWKRYIYLALILAVVVIFAIVTFAHVLRKRDLPTTLLALGVGMLVTIGPLVLLAA
ncbi:hypothetical protein [Gordonia neofelifaecis]|uniref:Transmembrane protein n=1 Tax=Gordonia neofelifaecis NRRL B-59395 TaxID=644548 RepID=F1YIS1_9ACTN|nr:hypothetical protein [Gordonia neofelifaecis]EGD55379.1 hypothetical protein SCNU_08976 [Gordonia neofelifaecis NRRL B-59395]